MRHHRQGIIWIGHLLDRFRLDVETGGRYIYPHVVQISGQCFFVKGLNFGESDLL